MTEMVPLTTVPLPVRLRASDYLLLDEAGAFEPYGKTELLDGEIVYVNAQHRPDAFLKGALYQAMTGALRRAGSPFGILIEASVALSDTDTPEPDLTLTNEPRGSGLVPAASVGLIVEVADATLASDMTRKASIYARADIAEYWVADVNGRAVHQMWAPTGEGYTERRTVPFGDRLVSLTVDGLAIDTADF